MTLKYPNCEVCKALRKAFHSFDVTDKQINDYHESKIGWEDFPRYLQDDVLDVVIAVTRAEDQKTSAEGDCATRAEDNANIPQGVRQL